jgi:hypothetical protein
MEAYGRRVLARIKSEGLEDIGEEALKTIVSAACDELVAEVQGNNKAWDDYAVMPINAVKELILKQVDKLDGEVG